MRTRKCLDKNECDLIKVKFVYAVLTKVLKPLLRKMDLS